MLCLRRKDARVGLFMRGGAGGYSSPEVLRLRPELRTGFGVIELENSGFCGGLVAEWCKSKKSRYFCSWRSGLHG